jgi:hypothetical protein
MYCCLHYQNYINKNQSGTNDDSLGTEKIDSAPDKTDASVAQHGAGSNNEDGGSGIIQPQVKILKGMQLKVVL